MARAKGHRTFLDYHGNVGSIWVGDIETTLTNVSSKGTGAGTVIVGLGDTGFSCARFLASQGRRFKVVDSRQDPPALTSLREMLPDVEVELGGFDEQSLLTAEELVVSPGVSLRTPAIEKATQAGVSITGDIDIFSKQVSAPIIAITGSNGKSTVVAIVAEIMRQAGRNFGLGGNLDGSQFKPALDLLQEEEKELYILELSSFQLETTESLGAEVACLLNLSADHMDRYDDLQQYLDAKKRIFNDCKQAVVNRDDPVLGLLEFDVPVWDFGFSKPEANGVGLLEANGEQFLAYQFEKIIPVSELKIVGQHNIANAMAAAAIGLAIGIEIPVLRRGLRDFSGLPHRCQWVANLNGVDFYNDSKGTNVGATRAAVEGLGERLEGHIVLIAGGDSKGADFSSLTPIVNRWCKEIVLIGQDAVQMAAYFDAEVKTFFANDMQEAVSVAFDHASAGDAVLLSPACASFDMFENFEQRGQAFISAVEKL